MMAASKIAPPSLRFRSNTVQSGQKTVSSGQVQSGTSDMDTDAPIRSTREAAWVDEKTVRFGTDERSERDNQ